MGQTLQAGVPKVNGGHIHDDDYYNYAFIVEYTKELKLLWSRPYN